jgi:hypothetical protein
MERFLDTPWLNSFAATGKPQLTLKEMNAIEVLPSIDQNKVRPLIQDIHNELATLMEIAQEQCSIFI